MVCVAERQDSESSTGRWASAAVAFVFLPELAAVSHCSFISRYSSFCLNWRQCPTAILFPDIHLFAWTGGSVPLQFYFQIFVFLPELAAVSHCSFISRYSSFCLNWRQCPTAILFPVLFVFLYKLAHCSFISETIHLFAKTGTSVPWQFYSQIFVVTLNIAIVFHHSFISQTICLYA